METRDLIILRKAQDVVRRYNKLQMKRPLTSMEIQQREYAQSKIDQEYAKPMQINNADLVFELATNHAETGGYDSWKDEIRNAYIAGWNACERVENKKKEISNNKTQTQ